MTAHRVPAGRLDINALVGGGGMFRYRTRNSVRPVASYQRAADMVFGAVFAFAAALAFVVWRAGVV